MKKILLVVIALLLSSCSNSNFIVKLDYARKYDTSAIKVKINHDFGTFNNARVMYITTVDSGYLQAKIYRLAGDKIFYSRDGYEVSVYYNNDFYNLTEAHENNILSINDIDVLYDEYNEYNEFSIDFVNYLNFLRFDVDETDVSTNGWIESKYSSYISYGEYNQSKVYLFEGFPNKTSKEILVSNYNFKCYVNDVIMVLNNDKYY